MAKSNNRSRDRRNADLDVMEMARERPFAAAAAAAGAAATGLFLWSRRAQISDQLGHLSDQLGEWRESMRSGGELEMAETSSRSTGSRRRRTQPASTQ